MKNKIQDLNLQASGYSYSGASYDRVAFKGFEGISLNAAQDINDNLATLRNRSRMLTMLSPIAKSVIETYVTNVIGRGLKLQSRIDGDVLGLDPGQAEDLEDQIEREFSLWADDRFNCDINATKDFYDIQQLVFTSYLESGDSFVLIRSHGTSPMRPYSLRLQVIEADRCSTPNVIPGMVTTAIDGNHIIYDGVEVDRQGEVVSYHFADYSPLAPFASLQLPVKWFTVQARGTRTGLPNVLHIFDATRPEQYRGVPILSEVIQQNLQINRYAESEVMAALLQSYASIWITRSKDTPDEDEIPQLGDDAWNQDEDEVSWSPASITYLADGQTPQYIQPTHPNSNYPSFMETNLLQIGAGVGIPYEILTKKHDSSYSASRAAHLDFAKEVERKRASFVKDFCEPVFEWFMCEAVNRGRIKAPGFFDDPIKRKAYLKADWIGPSQGMLSPKEEVEACITAISEGLMTREQASMMLNGYDWYSNLEGLRRERELLAELPPDPNRVETIQYDGKGGEQDEQQILDGESLEEPDTDRPEGSNNSG